MVFIKCPEGFSLHHMQVILVQQKTALIEDVTPKQSIDVPDQWAMNGKCSRAQIAEMLEQTGSWTGWAKPNTWIKFGQPHEAEGLQGLGQRKARRPSAKASTQSQGLGRVTLYGTLLATSVVSMLLSSAGPGELGRCMESFTARIEAKGEPWQDEMQGLERNICMWRDNTENEMVGMKKALRDEMQKMMVERGVWYKHGRDTKKMEPLVASRKVDLLFELRRKKKARRLEKQEIDSLIEDKMEKRLSQRLEIVSGGKEKVIADMKNELCLLWAELDMLSKSREEIKDTVNQLAHIAKEAKHSIGEEHNALKHENGMLKRQLQYFKKESMQMRADNEDFKDIVLEVEHIRSSLEKVKAKEQSMKTVLDRVMEYKELGRKGAEDNSDSNGGSRERMLIMEKVGGISQLYLGGLEEVRSVLLSFKLECVDRMGELEGRCAEIANCQHEQETKSALDAHLPLKEIVLDGLESRVSHFKSGFELTNNPKDDRVKVLAIMEKDRNETSVALNRVASAAQNADEFVVEMVRSFSIELSTVMRQSHKIQENLAAKTDMAYVSTGELKRMSEDMNKEMQVAMVVIFEAHAKRIQIKEGLDKEIFLLKEYLLLEKEAAAIAGANATDVATNIDAALLEICRLHRMRALLCLSK
ncbi:hypothetical protein L7F22_023517 [Adiantum nelumboides]|nr:hypothetical protein [Adiantum nelumboides]